MDERTEKLIAALAEYCNCEPHEITGYAIGIEHVTGTDLNFSSAYGGPPWRIPAFTGQVLRDVEKSELAKATEGETS